MFRTGVCPKCSKTITSVKLENVDIKEGFQSSWRGVSYCCPYCNVVISVQIDPIAIKTDIIDGLFDKLRKGK